MQCRELIEITVGHVYNGIDMPPARLAVSGGRGQHPFLGEVPTMSSISHPAPARRGPHVTIKEFPVGTVFGRFTVIEGPFAKEPDLTRKRYYRCQCECGAERDVQKANLLRSGPNSSCGCWCRDRLLTHGETGTRLYVAWGNMIKRCCDMKDTRYADYGGRGIQVCGEWRNSYEAFRDWAHANGYRDDLTIERKEVNKGYCPENCCWIPMAEQARNRRNSRPCTAFGETKLLSDWAKDPRCQVTRVSLMRRLDKQWDMELAMTTPAAPGIKQNPKILD